MHLQTMHKRVMFDCYRYHWWLVGYPITFILFVHEEIRKYLVYRNPNGWFARNTVSF